jgi:hypothetical protein
LRRTQMTVVERMRGRFVVSIFVSGTKKKPLAMRVPQ